MFFHAYPYTDVHELNLDWMLAQIKAINSTLNNFIVMNTIKYADPFQWNITSQYESNTIVMEPNTGTAYISVQPVPAGISISNTDFWTAVFDLSLLFGNFNDNITFNNEHLNIVSAHVYPAGSWLIWKNNLYLVTTAINLGDALQPGTNIQRKTVEELVSDLNTALTNAINNTYSTIMAYVNDKFTKTYPNVTAMIADTDIEAGDYIRTLGYSAAGDEGNGIYYVVNSAPSTHYETLSNGLYAQLVYDKYLSIKALGAPSDGTGNVSPYIKEAIDMLASGGTIFFPAGTYRCTEDCRGIHTDNLIFTGRNAEIWYDYDRTTTLDFYPVFMIYSDNVTIKDLRFRSNASVARADGVHFILCQDTASNITIKDNHFYQCTGAIIYFGSNVQTAEISGNVLDTSNADGILMSDGSTNIVVRDNIISNTGDDAISCVWNDGYPTPISKVLITGNLITGGVGHGINVCHAVNITIEGNSIVGCDAGGISVYRWGTNPVYAKNIHITGNQITDVKKNGILIDGCDDSVIESNHIIDPELVGIRLGNYNNLRIIGNVIDMAPYGVAIDNQNIFANCNNLAILNNDIRGFAGNAVALAPAGGTVVNQSIVAGNVSMTTETVYAAYNFNGLTGLDVVNNITKNGIINVDPSCTSVVNQNNV